MTPQLCLIEGAALLGEASQGARCRTCPLPSTALRIVLVLSAWVNGHFLTFPRPAMLTGYLIVAKGSEHTAPTDTS